MFYLEFYKKIYLKSYLFLKAKTLNSDLDPLQTHIPYTDVTYSYFQRTESEFRLDSGRFAAGLDLLDIE
jgi:hypothetical protein